MLNVVSGRNRAFRISDERRTLPAVGENKLGGDSDEFRMSADELSKSMSEWATISSATRCRVSDVCVCVGEQFTEVRCWWFGKLEYIHLRIVKIC